MNRFFCWLTGGHKYDCKDIKTEMLPDDHRWVILSAKCSKCGVISEFAVNVDCEMKNDLIGMEEEMGCVE